MRDPRPGRPTMQHARLALLAALTAAPLLAQAEQISRFHPPLSYTESSAPNLIAHTDEVAWFVAWTSQGQQVFVTDGTPAGTRQITQGTGSTWTRGACIGGTLFLYEQRVGVPRVSTTLWATDASGALRRVHGSTGWYALFETYEAVGRLFLIGREGVWEVDPQTLLRSRIWSRSGWAARAVLGVTASGRVLVQADEGRGVVEVLSVDATSEVVVWTGNGVGLRFPSLSFGGEVYFVIYQGGIVASDGTVAGTRSVGAQYLWIEEFVPAAQSPIARAGGSLFWRPPGETSFVPMPIPTSGSRVTLMPGSAGQVYVRVENSGSGATYVTDGSSIDQVAAVSGHVVPGRDGDWFVTDRNGFSIDKLPLRASPPPGDSGLAFGGGGWESPHGLVMSVGRAFRRTVVDVELTFFESTHPQRYRFLDLNPGYAARLEAPRWLLAHRGYVAAGLDTTWATTAGHTMQQVGDAARGATLVGHHLFMSAQGVRSIDLRTGSETLVDAGGPVPTVARLGQDALIVDFNRVILSDGTTAGTRRFSPPTLTRVSRAVDAFREIGRTAGLPFSPSPGSPLQLFSVSGSVESITIPGNTSPITVDPFDRSILVTTSDRVVWRYHADGRLERVTPGWIVAITDSAAYVLDGDQILRLDPDGSLTAGLSRWWDGASSTPVAFAATDSGKLFTGYENEVWISDGITVSDPLRLPAGKRIEHALAIPGHDGIIALVHDVNLGESLWVVDGSTGTREWIDLGPECTEDTLGLFRIDGSDLVFVGSDGISGIEVWRASLHGAVDGAPLVVPFEDGCPGDAGTPRLVRSGQPRCGARGFGLVLDRCPPATSAVFALAAQQGYTRLGACGFYLDSNCLTFPVVTDGGGQTDLGLPIPADPGLVGLSIFAQAVVIDATGPSAGLGPTRGLTVSDALEIVVGH